MYQEKVPLGYDEGASRYHHIPAGTTQQCGAAGYDPDVEDKTRYAGLVYRPHHGADLRIQGISFSISTLAVEPFCNLHAH